jgi:hypothetical protein
VGTPPGDRKRVIGAITKRLDNGRPATVAGANSVLPRAVVVVIPIR